MKMYFINTILLVLVLILFPPGLFPEKTAFTKGMNNSLIVTFPPKTTADDKWDILSWKVFSKIIHQAGIHGVTGEILIKQDEIAGNWLLDKSVNYNSEQGRLISQYYLSVDDSVRSYAAETVNDLKTSDIEILSNGNYGEINKKGFIMHLKSSDGVDRKAFWRLLP